MPNCHIKYKFERKNIDILKKISYNIFMIMKKTIKLNAFLLPIILLLLHYLTFIAYGQSNDIKKSFPNTKITPVLEAEIKKGQNLVYCISFQLAWNQLCNKIIKEPLMMHDAPNYVNPLNDNLTIEIFLKPNEYVAQAGFIRDDIVKKINTELVKKFGEAVTLVSSDLPPDGILSYSYLLKNFEFEHVFDNITDPLKFKMYNNNFTNVESFGLKKLSSKKPKDLKQRTFKNAQVYACYYDKIEGFIIKLYPKTGEIITISTLPPLETLKKTYQHIDSICRNNSYKRSFENEDTFQIPKINFKLTHSFDELTQKPILNKNLLAKGNYFISKAIQIINFSLDEKGVKLESSGRIDCTKGLKGPITPQDFIVNGPFIIYLTNIIQEEFNQGEPYFIMYVDNDDLLVKK